MGASVKRGVFFLGGTVSLILAIIGIPLPLLPTTPFVLLAAFCFARSSEKFHGKLLRHPVFGRLIQDWENEGVIPLKAKLLSSAMMLVMTSYPLLYREFDLSLKVVLVMVVVCSLTFIWSRPSRTQAL